MVKQPAVQYGILIIVQLWLSMGTGFLAFIAGLQGIDVTCMRPAISTGSATGIRR